MKYEVRFYSEYVETYHVEAASAEEAERLAASYDKDTADPSQPSGPVELIYEESLGVGDIMTEPLEENL
jgi:hypothetical protein